MFQARAPVTNRESAHRMLALIFHAAVHNIRTSNRSAVLSIMSNMMQVLMLLGMFYMFTLIFGTRSAGIRGDYILFMMSGIMMFKVHTGSFGAVSGAAGPTSAMMKHSPMNTIIAIGAAAIGNLYIQTITFLSLLFLYHTLFAPITIDEPVETAGMVLLAWSSGIAGGMIVKSLKPWAPGPLNIIATIYQRANLIFSGKMMVANTMPGFVLQWFDWNPLFHIIDQTRGHVFLNYNPHYSELAYPIKVTLACLVIGLMCEYYLRKYISISWTAGK